MSPLYEPNTTRPRQVAGDEYTYEPVARDQSLRPLVVNAVSEPPVEEGTNTRPEATAGVP